MIVQFVPISHNAALTNVIASLGFLAILIRDKFS